MQLHALPVGGLDLAAAHAMPVSAELAAILRCNQLDVSSISNSALCGCVPWLLLRFDLIGCFLGFMFSQVLVCMLLVKIVSSVSAPGWEQHAYDLHLRFHGCSSDADFNEGCIVRRHASRDSS